MTPSLTEIKAENKALAAGLTGDKPFRATVLGNVITYPIKDYLENALLRFGVTPEVTFGDYDNILQESASAKTENAVVVFWELMNLVHGFQFKSETLSEEEVTAIVEKAKAEIDLTIQNLQDCSCVLWNRFSALLFNHRQLRSNRLDQVCNTLNEYVEKRLPTSFVLVDIDKVIATTGVDVALDKRFLYSSSSPYTAAFYFNYITYVRPVIASLLGKGKKALILDCDNTLWKGIIGEDGMEGIKMSDNDPKGIMFHEIQHLAAMLNRRGILLGLCSKNNPEDVDEVLKNHSDMFLREENLTLKFVNWTDKATNLRDLAKTLNIGLDSIVFIDDSEFEVNLIREQLPEVTVLQVPKKLYEYPDLLRSNLGLFFHLSETREDLNKAQMYKENFQRDEAKKQHGDIEDYLASLGMVLTIYRNDASHVARMSQMTQKTNQFNLTTQRYSEADITRFVEDDAYDVYCFEVADKFGSAGITGMSIVEHTAPGRADIGTLLMSCRVLGRNIERAFVQHMLNDLKESGTTTITATYLKTYKNAQVKEFYEKFGFRPIGVEEGKKSYTLALGSYEPELINYITVTLEE